MSGSIEWQLGEMNARLRAIETRLADGTDRHAELDKRDDAIEQRLVSLELIEAKRVGVFAIVTAIGSVIGGVATLAVQALLKKIGG